ncbi:hypothetical protein BXO88_10095 [Oribacterium sp. C9]|uniref:MFS transporter n=1 Tax=Oribacterium sp. C9 TaxID=1943579 RepID=UPI00098F98FE|nr:MFS transporter [Oribacterium sp. C9]OON85968.1 hypothetical protein BXO88_10095 [Oribacterium sp. C9]
MENNVKRWPVIVVGIAVMFFSGIIYAWSILKAPLMEEMGWGASQLALNFTITMCTFCIGGMISGILIKRINLRLIFLMAAVCSLCGFYISSTLHEDGLSLLYLSYGGLAGLGIGIAYNAIISVVNEWFSDMKGTASGALMMSFGASALVLGNVANSMIGSIGWRVTYMLLGVMTCAALVAASLILKHKDPNVSFAKADEGTELHEKNVKAFVIEKTLSDSDDAASDSVRETSKDDTIVEKKDYTTMEMIKRPSFLRFFLFLVLASAVGNSTISMARDVAIFSGAEAGVATMLAGILSLCNGAGRLLAGALFDKIGQRKTMLVDGIITITAPVLMLLAISMHSVPLVAIGLAVTGISYAFQPPVTSSVVASFYGAKNFPANFSVANTTLIPASFVATIGGVLFTSTGSYIAPFVLLLVFSVVSFVLNLSVKNA